MDGNGLMDEQDYMLARSDEHAWQQAHKLGISRRRFLTWMAASSAAVATGMGLSHVQQVAQAAPAPLGPLVKPTPPDLFYNFDGGPVREMRWEAMHGRGYLVPSELFFYIAHSNAGTPRIDVSTWRLKVEGSGISRPLELTYDEILDMPSVSVVKFIECAGNGRSFYETELGKPGPGRPIKLGLIGVAEWTGVPLREVLERAGLKRTARDVMPEGLDDTKIRRPMPISKAMAEDTLLVYAMNGQVLPPDHGFPVRALVPGWVGIANTKWVGRIEVSEAPLYSPWNTDLYVLIGPDYKPNPPAKGPALTVQNVKSAFELPWDGELRAGPRLLRGRAWSGQGKIAKVEVSLDRGISWQPARLREPNIAQAWARWDLDWDPRPGNYSLRARATDERGNTQPVTVPFNELRYMYHAVVGHPVTVVS